MQYAKPSRHRRRFETRAYTAGASNAADILANVLQALGLTPEKERLAQLWNNWAMVLGPEFGPLALPLGRRRDALLVAAEDAMSAQELHLQSAELLERVNAFMETSCFRKISVSLLLGEKTLCAHNESGRQTAEQINARTDAQRPVVKGIFLNSMDPASPVTRCYARFAKKAVPINGKGCSSKKI
ncbi:MAG: conserved hypothetical protein [Candidatus Desulfovibrio kirbyi]|jgi:hypothetical protein|uniref:DUF721 domain-containing protein n=1 Tax=Candidatus Desulfovibrio kirbyi TaxID=2696086 RepID=A0A6L2R787_9BACT|nr:DUF721 domain-containing protein [Desulfovibrio sp.]GFH63389.1 MAG: conserved hypothetical protein [Candidatus Desulfovibrio kirbyi]